MFKSLVKKIAAAAFWIILWQLFAFILAKPVLVPTPYSVLVRLFELCSESGFWATVAVSLFRITVGILISVITGVLLGVLNARFSLVRYLSEPILSLVKATPVASFIILALLWLSRDVLPVFITVLIVVPVISANICAGINSVDKDLYEVTEVFGFSLSRKLRRLYFPTVYPYFMSACRSSLGLAWKAGIAAEVLAVPGLSIGKMIYESKLYLETADLFAWTAVVVILSALIENVFCALLKKFEKGRVRDNASN